MRLRLEQKLLRIGQLLGIDRVEGIATMTRPEASVLVRSQNSFQVVGSVLTFLRFSTKPVVPQFLGTA
jgi:hypothetical protein